MRKLLTAILLAAAAPLAAGCEKPPSHPVAVPSAPVADELRYPAWPGVESSREVPREMAPLDPAEAARIDQAFAQALKVAEIYPPRILADAAPGAAGENPIWREFTVQRDREALDRGDNLNRNFQVWSKEGKVLLVRALLQSPSRDWAQFADYLYRPDGTLALMNVLLNTFEGDVSLRVIRYYDPKGEVTGQMVDKQDLQRGGPVMPPDRAFRFVPFTVYAKVTDLPFLAQLDKPKP